jgi:YHS domain-containing protein
MDRHAFVLSFGLAAAMTAGSVAAGQHEGHQAGTAASPSAAQVTDCRQAQPVVTGLLNAALKRLEDARLTNSAAAMRDAADDVQAALVDMRTQLAPCGEMQLASSAPAASDAHAGQATALAASPSATTGAAARATASAPPTSIADLKCTNAVDQRTAPRMLYQGRMYYFCTEASRVEFAKDPARFVTAPPQAAPAHAH